MDDLHVLLLSEVLMVNNSSKKQDVVQIMTFLKPPIIKLTGLILSPNFSTSEGDPTLDKISDIDYVDTLGTLHHGPDRL